MKGISLAIETIVYLILAVLVLSVLLVFFLQNVGPSQRQIELEAKRANSCLAYVTNTDDTRCVGKDGKPSDVAPEILNDIGSTCKGLKEFSQYYPCNDIADLGCIKKCCCKK